MNEIELAEMVGIIASAEVNLIPPTPTSVLRVSVSTDYVTERDAELANVELKRRGLSARVRRGLPEDAKWADE